MTKHCRGLVRPVQRRRRLELPVQVQGRPGPGRPGLRQALVAPLVDQAIAHADMQLSSHAAAADTAETTCMSSPLV